MVVTVLRRLDAPPDPGLTCSYIGGYGVRPFSQSHAVRGFPLWLRVRPLDYAHVFPADRRGSPGKYLERGRRYSNTSSESRKEVEFKGFHLCQFSKVPFRVLVSKGER